MSLQHEGLIGRRRNRIFADAGKAHMGQLTELNRADSEMYVIS